MTPTPCDVYVVSSVAALEMAENLLVTVNTIVRGLPESELREMRDRLEVAFYTADDLLLSITISPGLESLTINGASTTPSSVSTATSSHTATTADFSTSSSLPATVAADCGVVARPAVSSNNKNVLTPPPTNKLDPAPANPAHPIILSTRPNVGMPDYEFHPPFVRPGVPGPYVRPPIDPSKGDPAAYHVVTKGLYIGIFTNWIQCSPWVTKVAGNTHFKVVHWAEAMELYNSCLAAGACEVLS